MTMTNSNRTFDGKEGNKQTLKDAGYIHAGMIGACHILKDTTDNKVELWFANKNHASYGIIYKNTHLEFARSL